MVQAFEAIGYNKKKPFSIHNLLFHKGGSTIFFFNWIENLAYKNPVRGSLKIILVLLTLKIKKTPYIWTLHNTNFHHANRIRRALGKFIYFLLDTNSYLTLCHGLTTSKKRSLCYVPHPAFPTSRNLSTEKEERYLCFGRMLRYKKIESLIQSWPDNKKLLISGKFDTDYFLEIQALANRKPNIVISNQFVNQTDLESLIKNSKGVIIPNDGMTSIVSGAVFLGLRLGTPVYINSEVMLREIGSNVTGLYYINTWSDLNSVYPASETDILTSTKSLFSLAEIVTSLKNCI